MEDEKRIAALMEELESIKEELRQLKGDTEESAYEGEKLSHEMNGMLMGDRIAGPLGSVIGLGIGSFFGLFAGAAQRAEVKRISRG